MKTEYDFNKETERLAKLENRGEYFVDPCVALENAAPFKDQADYWEHAIYILRADTACRIAEAGKNPEDYGLIY